MECLSVRIGPRDLLADHSVGIVFYVIFKVYNGRSYVSLHHNIIVAAAAMTLMGCTTESENIYWPLSGGATPDEIISDTFGPRILSGEYDWHRGLDLPTDSGTPVYAVANGTVRKAGDDVPGYSQPMVQLEHCWGDSSVGCDGDWYTNYQHLSSAVVDAGEAIVAGQLIGYSGASEEGFEHLHFEVRDGGTEKEDAIHPMGVLPYDDEGAPDVTVIDATVSARGSEVSVFISLPADQPDLNRVSVAVSVYDDGDWTTVDEASFDINEWNHDYTLPDDDEEDLYLTDPDFNGITVDPEDFSASSSRYQIGFTFWDIEGVSSSDTVRVEATAEDVNENASSDSATATRE